MQSKSRSRSPQKPESRPGTGKSQCDPEKEELKSKLHSISARLAKIQLEKRKLSPLYRPSTSPKKEKKEKKSHKREFYHPKLEFVMAEAAYSPYLTPPTASYGEKTLRFPSKMKEIRFQGRDPIPEEGFPVDVDFARRRFVKEIINFKPRFEVRVSPSPLLTFILYYSFMKRRQTFLFNIWNLCQTCTFLMFMPSLAGRAWSTLTHISLSKAIEEGSLLTCAHILILIL
jgi:hypothetical protein